MPTSLAGYRGPLVVVGLGAGFAAVGAVPVAITFSMGIRSSATIIGMGFVGFGILLMTPGLVWCLVVRTQRGFRSWKRKRSSKKAAAAAAAAAGGGSGSDGVVSSMAADVTSSTVAARNEQGKKKKHSMVGSEPAGQRAYVYDVGDGGDNDGGGERLGEETPSLSGCLDHGGIAVSMTTAATQRPRCWPSTYVDPPPLIITDHIVRRASTPTVSAPATVSTATSGERNDDVRIVVDPPSIGCVDSDILCVVMETSADDDDDSSCLLNKTSTTTSESTELCQHS